MPDASEARTELGAQAVMAYVQSHPLAADNEAGIAQVWLLEMGVEVSRANLRDALDRLVEQRQLERMLLADGSSIYRAARAAPAA